MFLLQFAERVQPNSRQTARAYCDTGQMCCFAVQPDCNISYYAAAFLSSSFSCLFRPSLPRNLFIFFLSFLTLLSITMYFLVNFICFVFTSMLGCFFYFFLFLLLLMMSFLFVFLLLLLLPLLLLKAVQPPVVLSTSSASQACKLDSSSF